jgi:predicted component of type VI protein secretion system
MPAQLFSLEDGPNILLDKPIVLIGRHEECDIQLNSRKVSRKHCCVAQVEDYFVVRDLGSTNGVRINGVRVQEGTMRPGDELTIGNYRYQIQGDPTPIAAPRQPTDDEHTARAANAGDDQLESADEPVALPDNPGLRVPAGLKPPEQNGNGSAPAVANDAPLAQSSWQFPPAPPR